MVRAAAYPYFGAFELPKNYFSQNKSGEGAEEERGKSEGESGNDINHRIAPNI